MGVLSGGVIDGVLRVSACLLLEDWEVMVLDPVGMGLAEVGWLSNILKVK